jgi:hypothetical protein
MSAEEAPKEFGTCCICREEIDASEVCGFACGHCMHANCAFWMRRSSDLPLKCPMCRTEIDKKVGKGEDRYPLARLLFGVAVTSSRAYLCKQSASAILRESGLLYEEATGCMLWWLAFIAVTWLCFGGRRIFGKPARANSNRN